MNLKTFCTPAKIYFALAVLSAIMMLMNQVSVVKVVINLIIAFIWTVVLAWLCKHGLTMVSWGLVLLPFVMMLCASQNSYSSELLEGLSIGKTVKGIPKEVTKKSNWDPTQKS